MKRKIIGFVILVVISLLIMMIRGWYPVASVDGSPIFFKTWRTAEGAAVRFLNAQARAQGIAPVDFYIQENADLLLGVRRDTLTFLIEDKILAHEGDTVVDDFHALSEFKVAEALGVGGGVERGAELVYGLLADDFKDLVLLPQARRDVLREAFEERGYDFEAWFREVRDLKNVRLFFVPFQWSGEEVR